MAIKALSNVVVTYNATNITAYLNTASVEAVVNEIDTTNLASTGEEKTPGAVSWSVPVGGQWVKALDDVLGPDAVSPPSTLRTLAVQIGPSGARVVYTWTTNAFISNYKIEGTDPKGVVTWSGDLAVSGAPARTTP